MTSLVSMSVVSEEFENEKIWGCEEVILPDLRSLLLVSAAG